MNPIEEFRRHADECRRMSRVARDRQSRDTWNSLAERWLRCAANFETATGALKKPASPRRNASRSPLDTKRQKEGREGPRH
jgi:hypothetical protein